MATPILGTTVVALFLVGSLGIFLQSTKTWKEHLERYHALYICLLAILLVNSILSSQTLNISSGQGIWRHILTVSPVVALFATMGFNIAWSGDSRQRPVAVFLMGIYAVIVLLFFSNEHNYYRYSATANYLGFLVLLGLNYFLLVARVLAFKLRTAILATAAFTIVHTIAAEKPLKLSPEGQTVQEVVRFYEENGFQGRMTSTNHVLFHYFANIQDRKAPQYPRLTLSTVQNLPPGSIVIWESHYGFRPEWRKDARLDSLKADTTLKPLRSFLSSDKWFYAVVFEKVD